MGFVPDYQTRGKRNDNVRYRDANKVAEDSRKRRWSWEKSRWRVEMVLIRLMSHKMTREISSHSSLNVTLKLKIEKQQNNLQPHCPLFVLGYALELSVQNCPQKVYLSPMCKTIFVKSFCMIIPQMHLQQEEMCDDSLLTCRHTVGGDKSFFLTGTTLGVK